MEANKIHWIIWDRIVQRLQLRGIEMVDEHNRKSITDIKAGIADDMKKEGLLTEQEFDMLCKHNWCVLCAQSQACVCCPIVRDEGTGCGSSRSSYHTAAVSTDLEEALAACRKIRDIELTPDFEGKLEEGRAGDWLRPGGSNQKYNGRVKLSVERGLFDNRHVHKKWSDVLDGKDLFYGDTIVELIDHVENYPYKTEKFSPDEDGRLLTKSYRTEHKYVYYDPLYEFKRAYINGKKVQWRGKHSDHWPDWVDCDCYTAWCETDCSGDKFEYRIVRDEKSEKSDRRLTQIEMAMWLAKGNGVCSRGSNVMSTYYAACISEENEPVAEWYKVRRWKDTEWREPTLSYCFPEVLSPTPDEIGG